MHSTIKLMMRENIGQGLGAITACCSTKWKVVLNIYVYTHKLVLLLILAREASVYNVQ